MLRAHLQIVFEAQALDGDVAIRELQFLAQRNAYVAAGLEHDAQQIAQRNHRGQGTSILGQPYQCRDRVERIEQEVRLQRARQHVEPCLRELALQLELDQVTLGKAPVVHQRIADAGDGTVSEDVDEQFVVEALPEAAFVEMREYIHDEIDAHVQRAQEQREHQVQCERPQAPAAFVFEPFRGGEDEGREQSPHHHALDGERELARRETGDAGADREDVARPDDGGYGDPRGGGDGESRRSEKSAAPWQRSIGGQVFIAGDGGHETILVAPRDGRRRTTIRHRKSTVRCRKARVYGCKVVRWLRIP